MYSMFVQNVFKMYSMLYIFKNIQILVYLQNFKMYSMFSQNLSCNSGIEWVISYTLCRSCAESVPGLCRIWRGILTLALAKTTSLIPRQSEEVALKHSLC